MIFSKVLQKFTRKVFWDDFNIFLTQKTFFGTRRIFGLVRLIFFRTLAILAQNRYFLKKSDDYFEQNNVFTAMKWY